MKEREQDEIERRGKEGGWANSRDEKGENEKRRN